MSFQLCSPFKPQSLSVPIDLYNLLSLLYDMIIVDDYETIRVLDLYIVANWKCNFPTTRSVRLSSVGRSVMISQRGGKLHFQASSGARVFF